MAVVKGVSLGVSPTPRDLQALRGSRMTFNQGSGALTAAGGPVEPCLCPDPQSTPQLAAHLEGRFRESQRPDEALGAGMRCTFMMDFVMSTSRIFISTARQRSLHQKCYSTSVI